MEDILDKEYRSRHDGLINKVFWNENRVIRVNFISKHPNISEYLLSRYQDSDSYRETIQRIKLGIEEKPKCQSITIWTIKDVEKRNCAKENNLNFKEVWSLKEGKEFIDKLFKEGINTKREIP